MKLQSLVFLFFLFCIPALHAQDSEYNKFNIVTRAGLRSLFETSLGFEMVTSKKHSFELLFGYNYLFIKNEDSMCGLTLPNNFFNTSYQGPRVNFGWSRHIDDYKYVNVNLFFSSRSGTFNRDPEGCGSPFIESFEEDQKDYGFVVYFVRNRQPENQVKFYWGLGAGYREWVRTGEFSGEEKGDKLFPYVDVGIKCYLLPILK